MKTSRHIGRNDPCHCGSGRKFKNCCERRVPPSVVRSPAGYVVMGVAVVAVAAAIGTTIFNSKTEAPAQTNAAAPFVLPRPHATSVSLPPPGPAPEGKVWSAEHGHWHDAPGAGGQVVTTSGTTITPAGPAAPTPQPPGPVPEGKVWSPEHGHWHDLPGAAGQAVVTSGTTVVSGTPSTAAGQAAGQAPGVQVTAQPAAPPVSTPPTAVTPAPAPTTPTPTPTPAAPTVAPEAAAPASPK
jgi:hypothetical protein